MIIIYFHRFGNMKTKYAVDSLDGRANSSSERVRHRHPNRHRHRRVSAQILKFFRILQRLSRGGFDSNEHTREVCSDHRIQQLRPRGKIDRSLGGECERIPVATLPP